MVTGARAQLRLDWIDALLFAAGFVGVIVISVVLEQALGVRLGKGGLKAGVFVLAFGPALLRRLIFGAPKLPAPRIGALWSLVSIVGLFCLIAGVGAFALAAVTSFESSEATPDFVAQAEAELGPEESFAYSIVDPSETPQQRAERVSRAGAEARADRAAMVARAAADARTAWSERQSHSRSTALWIAAFGLLATLAGAFLTWLRYPRTNAPAAP